MPKSDCREWHIFIVIKAEQQKNMSNIRPMAVKAIMFFTQIKINSMKITGKTVHEVEDEMKVDHEL